MKYKRILLKLSGEAMMGNQQSGIDMSRLSAWTLDIKAVVAAKVQVAIVIGGGNIFRGVQGPEDGIDRVQGDYMGMLATIINGMALQSAFEKTGIKSKLLSGIAVEPLCEQMSKRRAIEYLDEGSVIIICGGTGNPYFTTDTAAALRAVEIEADALLKGTRVDGIYTADPEQDKKAVKYDALTFVEAYEKNLKIMDLTAFTFCHENNLPVIVFNMNIPGNLLKLINGDKIGTIVK
jgi:uridylate kinase